MNITDDEEEDIDILNENESNNNNNNNNNIIIYSDEEFDTINEDEDYKTAGFDAFTIPIGEKFTKKKKYLPSNFIKNDNENYDFDDDIDIDNNNDNDNRAEEESDNNDINNIINEFDENNFMIKNKNKKINTFSNNYKQIGTNEYDNHQIRKSKSVATQCKFYDKIATLRIHMQTV